MLLMVEKGNRGRMYHSICPYARANNKYIKDYDKNKESSYILYWDELSYMDGQCHKSFQQIILSGSKMLLNLMKIS